MRELIIKRINELKDTYAKDRFGKPNRRGVFPMGVRFDIDFDFSKLEDEALVVFFERVVASAYQQR